MANQFQTTIYLQVASGDDAELDVTVHYTIERSFNPSYMNIGERQEVAISKIVETASEEPVGNTLRWAIDTHELRKNILAQYLEGLEDDRADYHRDLRQDREMDRTAA